MEITECSVMSVIIVTFSDAGLGYRLRKCLFFFSIIIYRIPIFVIKF